MPGGQYLVSWTDNGGGGGTDGNGSHVRAAIMSGTASTNVSATSSSIPAPQATRRSAVTVLADGRILVVWTDAGRTG